MRTVILAIGSELLGVDRADTNSLRMTAPVLENGGTVLRKAVVGDEIELIADEIRRAVREAELVLVCGGLGPTADDLTREAAALAVDRALHRDDEIERWIEERFRAFGRPMPESNRRQAMVLEGAAVLPNPHGSAPGQRLELGESTLFLFPGVPRELQGMLDVELAPWLASRKLGRARPAAVLRVACVPESELQDRVAELWREWRRDLTVLSKPGEIELRLAADDDAELERRVAALRDRLGDAVYAQGGEASLPSTVLELLRERGETLMTAESCTGGMIGARLTDVAGSSVVYVGGVVAYADPVKARLLGVPTATLERFGAVSRETVEAMAVGGRAAWNTDWSVAVSGIAGPGGGSAEKPVGTVHIGVAGPGGTVSRRVQLPADREYVRRAATAWALDQLRRAILDADVKRSDR